MRWGGLEWGFPFSEDKRNGDDDRWWEGETRRRDGMENEYINFKISNIYNNNKWTKIKK